ncbi:MAG: gamma-butyrobetaine hydroxylase-like domain-containing protein [Planctomycetota bacterium]
MSDKPAHLDLVKDQGLTIRWQDGTTSFYPIAYLRKMSPSAEQRALRDEMASNPLTVLPSGMGGDGPLTAVDAEMVGHYALKIRFSDGHDTGLFSWRYLREIDPADSDAKP